MSHLNLQPKMVGREEELKELLTYLDKAAEGEGNMLFISGEAGIGKTRLVEELKQIAQERGFQILSGNCMYESLTPFMPIMEALRSGGLESLFAEEAPKVEAVYLVTNTGILIKDVVREETELDPDVFASMFTTVTDFINESLSKLSGEDEKGRINTLGSQNYRILIENNMGTNLVVILTGKENEFLLNDMRDILAMINKTFKETLEKWGGDESKVSGIEGLLKTFITSGKYDGIYYGKDDPKIRRNLLFENVFLGLARYARGSPTLLCIEDLQWIDPSSLAIMHYVARNTKYSGLLIVGTYRPEDIITSDERDHLLVKIMQLMDRENLYEKIELERFTEGDINEFLNVILGKIDFADELGVRVFKETEGNPLFVIQLLGHMVDERIILNDRGRWILTRDIKDINIPSKIFNVIERRLNRLEKDERKILDYASVIGEVFNSSVLTDALKINRTNLLERLRSLEQTHRLIHYHNRNFKFDHSKIKEFLYSEIPEELREDYHRIIADSIENLNRNNLDEIIGDLAFHYYQCKNREKALYYLIKAAERAKKEYSNEEAIRFFSFALELENDPKKKRSILEELGGIYTWIGDYQNSIKNYEHALVLSKQNKEKARIKAGIGNCYYRMGKYNESIKICDEALTLIKGEDCEEEAFALKTIGGVYMRKGEFNQALEYFDSSLGINRRIGNQKGIAQSLNIIGLIHWSIGEYDKALKYYKKGLNISEKNGDLHFVATYLDNIGLVYVDRGDYDLALHYYEKSINLMERIGDQFAITALLHNIGCAYINQGELGKALEYVNKSLNLSKRNGLVDLIAYNYWRKAEINFKKGDLKLALDFSDRAIELSNKIGTKEVIAGSFRIFGMIYSKQNKWQDSIKNFDQSIKIFKEIGLKKELAESHFEFGLMYKLKGDHTHAKLHLDNAINIYNELKVDKESEKIRAILETL